MACAWEEAQAHFDRGVAAKEGQGMDDEMAALLAGLGRAQIGTLERYRRYEILNTRRPAFDYYVAAGDVLRAQAAAEVPTPSSRGVDQLIGKALDLSPRDSRPAGRLLVRHGLALARLGDFAKAIESRHPRCLLFERPDRENDISKCDAILFPLAHDLGFQRFSPRIVVRPQRFDIVGDLSGNDGTCGKNARDT